VARRLLVDGTSSQVFLLGRSHRPSKLLDEVVALGGKVMICDVTDAVQLESFKAITSGSSKHVDLVVHCAGAVADELLVNVTREHCESVLRPKIVGTLLLRGCFPTARFIMFSSTSSVLGVVGQSTYAGANCFMDEVASQWSYGISNSDKRGLCTSIQWGGWGEVGMSVSHNISPLPGESYFTTNEGLNIFQGMLSTEASTCYPVRMALSVDWERYTLNPSVAAAGGNTLFQAMTEIKSVGTAGTHTLAGFRFQIGPTVVCYERSFGGQDAVIGERPDMAHVVDGDAILPAASYVSWSLECVAMESALTSGKKINKKDANGQHRFRLRSCRFLRPLDLRSRRQCKLVMSELNEVGGSISISCEEELYASVYFDWPVKHDKVEVVSLPAMILGEWDSIPEPYETFSRQGFDYGPSFGRLREISIRSSMYNQPHSSEARATVMMINQYVPSAGTLDSCLQLVSLTDRGVMGVPTKLELLEWFSSLSLGTPATVSQLLTVQAKPQISSTKSSLFDLLLLNNSMPVVKMSGVELFPLSQAHSTFSFRRCKPPPKQHDVMCSIKSLDSIKLDASEDGSLCAVIEVGDCDLSQVLSLVEDVRDCLKHNPLKNVSIFPRCVSKQTLRKDSLDCHLVASVIYHCVADFGIKVSVEGKVHEGIEEEPVVLSSASVSTCSSGERFKACCDPDGVTEGVWFERCILQPELGSHEVEIKTSCWALNFRDVLVSRGAIPMDTNGQQLGIGGECGGVVVRIGSLVSKVKVGDEVVAVPPDGMGSFVVVREEFVSPPLPWSMQMTDNKCLNGIATTIASTHSNHACGPLGDIYGCKGLTSQTLVYATAWLALEWQARVVPGEVVLVHSAAGGVGLAAIFLLQRKNCIIYGTASTEEKRKFLSDIGCHGVFDSRNVEAFSNGIRAAEAMRTGGQNTESCVDVVLNSLTGDAVHASLSLLNAFGRFVELGKRSSFEDESLSMKPFLKVC